MISFCKEAWMSQMAKCFQLLSHLINWFMLWTDPRSLSAYSHHACWNSILIPRHEYKYSQWAISDVHLNENVITLWLPIPFEILQQEKTKWRKWVKCFWDDLYYDPRSRKLRIIMTPLPGELIQFARAKQNESVLLWPKSRRESEFEWYLQRD